MNDRIELAAYYFPNYHADARNEREHGPGWSEWELVKRAEPRFPGHRQPLVPAWGYEDEADPEVMARKIDVAAEHGIDTFIFDWYHYEDGPFLQRALDEGFLGAPNNDRLKFALMWANHTWINIHPAKSAAAGPHHPTLYPGEISPAAFDRIGEHIITDYFMHPSYWTIDGKPYFSIYELSRLMAGLGSVDETRRTLDRFRQACSRHGLPGLHLNAVLWGNPILPGEESLGMDRATLLDKLGFDSFSTYVWIHHVHMERFPQVDYDHVRDGYFAYWDHIVGQIPLPYLPNVTMGWDASPRTVQSDVFRPIGYPFMSTIAGNTPERFREALRMARARLQASPGEPRVLTLNAWNEWTEGSYLEPDTVHGMGYLEAIREVFPPEHADAPLSTGDASGTASRRA